MALKLTIGMAVYDDARCRNRHSASAATVSRGRVLFSWSWSTITTAHKDSKSIGAAFCAPSSRPLASISSMCN